MSLEIRFFIDPQTKEPHFRRHGLADDDVVAAFQGRVEDCRGRKGTRLAIGRTPSGHPIRIIFSVTQGDAFIITAYPLAGKDLKAFNRRQK